MSYERSNYEYLLFAACAVIRKHLNDRDAGTAYTMRLDEDNDDCSYLFGRLLAIAEHVEQLAGGRDDSRVTNSERYRAAFVSRPMHTWGVLEKALKPYFSRLFQAVRGRYMKMIGEITEKISERDKSISAGRLDCSYLLAYCLQKNELNKTGIDAVSMEVP